MTKEKIFMSNYLIRHPNGFPLGYTTITQIKEQHHDTGINFGILKIKSGEEIPIHSELESAYLLIHGKCIFAYEQIEKLAERTSCFDQDPYVIHIAAQQHA